MSGTTVKIETFSSANRLTVATAAGVPFDGAGIGAVLTALGSHFSGLSGPNQAAVAGLVAAPPPGAPSMAFANFPGHWVVLGPNLIDATILAASLSTVAGAISTALTSAGYTCITTAVVGG